MATMTYAYTDSTAVLGPLAQAPEPGSYDLCLRHAERTSVPRGWEVIRLPLDGTPVRVDVVSDDLMALADAVRAIGLGAESAQPTAPPPPEPPEAGRGGHLRLVTG